MFRKKRGRHSGNLLGFIFILVGLVVLIYAIPLRFWVFLFGFGCLMVGILISKF